MIDTCGVDLIHAHSSHHFKGIEVYQGKLILYGCGDFISDYEGITGHEFYRSELTLMYFPSINLKTKKLVRLDLVPMQLRNFQVKKTNEKDFKWVMDVLNRESRKFKIRFEKFNEHAIRMNEL